MTNNGWSGGNTWTIGRERELVRLHAANVTYADIAKALGISAGAVCGKAARLGLKQRKLGRRSRRKLQEAG